MHSSIFLWIVYYYQIFTNIRKPFGILLLFLSKIWCLYWNSFRLWYILYIENFMHSLHSFLAIGSWIWLENRSDGYLMLMNVIDLDDSSGDLYSPKLWIQIIYHFYGSQANTKNSDIYVKSVARIIGTN